jgi:hypothetical protein
MTRTEAKAKRQVKPIVGFRPKDMAPLLNLWLERNPEKDITKLMESSLRRNPELIAIAGKRYAHLVAA